MPTAGTEAASGSLILEGQARPIHTLNQHPSRPAIGVHFIDAGAHVTSLVVSVFDDHTGELIDQENQNFTQQIGVNLIGQGVKDILPIPFGAARAVGDLVARPRINTSVFSIDGHGRSGGFDAMRDNAAAFDALAGAGGWRSECRFFPAGVDAQVDVIRWIKTKMESPNVREAFLIDPFLGADALRRVVVRQGNESVKLTILVSPGNIAPDAATTDVTTSPGQHVDDLVETARSLADELCGEIEIFHVQRGVGTRQAFHDRYLGLVQRDGTVRVYLLSNSLNRAAGVWPFAFAELDTPTAWQIAAYVTDLRKGYHGEKDLKVMSVWQSQASGNAVLARQLTEGPFDHASYSAYMQLSDLDKKGSVFDRASTDPIVERLVAALPDSLDNQWLSDRLIQGMSGRDHFLPAIINRLSEIPNCRDVVDLLEKALLDRLFERLTPNAGLFGIAERLPLLRFAGEALSRRPRGTYLIRDRMNPLADSCARNLEIGRAPMLIPQLFAGINLVIIGLEAARAKGEVSIAFRKGIAKDYAHLLGRLLGSYTSRSLFGKGGRGMDFLAPRELAREAIRIVGELAADAALDFNETANQLFSDSRIPSDLLNGNGGQTADSSRGHAAAVEPQ
jgi:hypothetical protein